MTRAISTTRTMHEAHQPFVAHAQCNYLQTQLLLILHDYLFMEIEKSSTNCTPPKLPRIQHQNLAPQRIYS